MLFIMQYLTCFIRSFLVHSAPRKEAEDVSIISRRALVRFLLRILLFKTFVLYLFVKICKIIVMLLESFLRNTLL